MNIDNILKIAGPILAASVAISLFYFTTRRDLKREKRKLEIEQRNRLRYLTHQIKDVIDAVNLHIENVRHYQKHLRDKPIGEHHIFYAPLSGIERLKKVLSEEHSFTTLTTLISQNEEKNVEMFSSLTMQVDYVYEALTSIDHMVNNHNDHQIKEQFKFQSVTDNIKQLAQSLTIRIQRDFTGSKEATELLKEFIIMNDRIIAAGDSEMITYHKHLVNPIFNITQRYLTATFPEVNSLLEIAKWSEEANRIYRQLNDFSLREADLIEISISSITHSKNMLEQLHKALINALKKL